MPWRQRRSDGRFKTRLPTHLEGDHLRRPWGGRDPWRRRRHALDQMQVHLVSFLSVVKAPSAPPHPESRIWRFYPRNYAGKSRGLFSSEFHLRKSAERRFSF
jgi:hypothetical protein